jgi:hypothetical protein
MDNNEGMPGWIICEDLLVKLKAELANEAIIILQNEVKSGRMKVEGSMVSSDEHSKDTERDLFVANNIAEEGENMIKKYSDYINLKESDHSKLSSKDVEMIDVAKKLILAIGEISMLMRYRRDVEEWINEIEKVANIKEPFMVLSSTINGRDDVRFEILKFATTRQSFIREDIFSKEERKIMEDALSTVS